MIKKDGTLYPVEAKKKALPTQSDVCRFDLLRKTGKPIAPGALLSLYDKVFPISGKTVTIPIGYL